MNMTKEELVKSLIGTSIDEDKTSYFSSSHVMTNKELIAQVWGYAAEISKNYIPAGVVIQIGVAPVTPNGARLVVAIANSYRTTGYACTLYAVSRRNKLLEKVCDMFESGADDLSAEDYAIARKGRP